MQIDLTKEELKVILTCLSKIIVNVNSYRSLVNKTNEVTSIEKLFNKLKECENNG